MLRKMTVCGMVALSLVFATRVNSLFGEDGLSSPQPKTSCPNGPPLTQQIHEALKGLEKSREMHNRFNPYSLFSEEEVKRLIEPKVDLPNVKVLSLSTNFEAEMRRLIERKCPLCGGNHSSSECPLLRHHYAPSLNPPRLPSYCLSTYRPEASKERSSSKAYGLAGAGAAAAAGGLFGRRKEKQ
jgi:hypothetical protein